MATIRICNAEGCQRKHLALGKCRGHYDAYYEAIPTHRAAKARRNAAAKTRRSHPETTTAPSHVLVPDLPQTDLEARQRALIRAMVKSASETTTWDPLQYLAELLSDAEDVRDVRSSWTPTAWTRSEQ